MTKIQVWVGDLAKYNEGRLVGDWFTLPVNIGDMLDKVLAKGNEEYFIGDIECPFHAGNYSLEELNEIAERMEEFSEDENNVLSIILDSGLTDSIEDAIEKVENYEFTIYENCNDMSDVAYEIVENTGMLSGVPENIERYFDYESFGRDIEIEGYFYKVNFDTYIEIHM